MRTTSHGLLFFVFLLRADPDWHMRLSMPRLGALTRR